MTTPTPKIIHYCWFGHGELSDQAKKTLASWKRFAPGFEIRRCDESTFDVNCCEWTRKAYEAKKYAFVADYARFRMVHDFGGVYMDLGSELVRDITKLVEKCSPFSAIEELSRTATTGLIVAAPPRNPVIASCLACYEDTDFSDDPTFLENNTVNWVFTRELEKLGYVLEDRRQQVGEWTLLPSTAFNPVYGLGGYHIKKDTYSVHHYSASWSEPKMKTKYALVKRLSPFLGRRLSQVVGRVYAEVHEEGLLKGLQNCAGVACQVTVRRNKTLELKERRQ